jgi:hypothetical protein
MNRRNALLLAGALLPGLVLLVSVAYSVVVRQNVAAPAYDLLYTVYQPRGDGKQEPVQLAFSVIHDRLEVMALPAPIPGSHEVVLYRWHHPTRESRRIDIPLPESVAEGGAAVEVPELSNMRLSAAREAPDGYRFESADRGGLGLIGALYYRPDRNRARIEKPGVAYPVQPPPAAPGGWSLQFLGWIIDDG